LLFTIKFAHPTMLITAAQPRAAFVALVALVVAAGIPLAFAWARVLPEDAPPFKIEPGSYPSVDFEPAAPFPKRNRDVISVALLLCITLTYLIRFPGMPLSVFTAWLASITSANAAGNLIVAARIFLLIGTGLAACIAAVRPGRLRTPLIAAAGLTLLLWLLGPILQAAALS
jgi:hypothetical protein